MDVEPLRLRVGEPVGDGEKLLTYSAQMRDWPRSMARSGSVATGAMLLTYR